MKKMIFLLLFFCLFTCSLPVAAEESDSAADFYAEQYRESGADNLSDSLPDETRAYLEEYGIDPSDSGWVGSLTAESVFGHIWGFFKGGAKTPLKTGAGIAAVILISAALSLFRQKSSASVTAVYAAAVAAAAAVAGPIFSAINAAASALQGISVFMLSFVPVFAVITAASGAAVTSASMSALLLAAAQAVSYLSGFVILPLMGGYLAVSISAGLSPLMQKSGIAELLKRFTFWAMGLISTVFIGILGVQTTVNSSADTLASKTAKFILGSSVPLAGGALSEALGTVTASMRLLRSSVGVYGTVACAAILLPILAELLLWRAVLLITSGLADLFALPQISGFLKAVDSMMSVLTGILLLVGAVFIISLAVVVSAGKAQ